MAACLQPFAGLVRAYPIRTFAAAAFGVVLTGIVLNAVLFQRGRHPAPLFGPGPHARAARNAAAVPLPAPRPAERQAGVEALPVGQISRASPAASPTRPATGSSPAPARKEDGITQLLTEGGRSPPEATAKTAAADVLAAQRALQRLGYGVVPDGHYGSATRQAIETFERDRRLPAGQDLSPKLLHALAVAAGLRRG